MFRVLPLFEFKSGLESQQNVKSFLLLFCIILLLPRTVDCPEMGVNLPLPSALYTSPAPYAETHTLKAMTMTTFQLFGSKYTIPQATK